MRFYLAYKEKVNHLWVKNKKIVNYNYRDRSFLHKLAPNEGCNTSLIQKLLQVLNKTNKNVFTIYIINSVNLINRNSRNYKFNNKKGWNKT